ncbi:PPOX class F420-dependent oxidoreductase [Candidatus Nitrosotalea okcheonensis]|uniref:Putative Pyridoxamine 5'-phosphate oxidase n=1 Tax=Candidatus Nitrosotalea okcheonensis TaxID=1903276 RepID=A0A2H1FF78_9ARCH|nr:PPOX class F420-dependent oxidoreductase [Candidatus Nitrosotalea okcheonensis]SMH71407.1 putative Pyridoxamine 5'-phosphate oxidase [Candidatus Nitrosotalea okcheonensis]
MCLQEMSSDKITPFLDAKYINLETYRSNNQAVKTPVWFVIDDGIIYVATPPTTGKVKRLNCNKNVRIVPSDMKGNPRGEWIDATAYFANESESMQAIKLRKKKYGLMAKLIGIAVYRKGTPLIIGIKV